MVATSIGLAFPFASFHYWSRWVAALASFDFIIHYKAGKTNTDADMLSRKPYSDGSLSDNDTDHVADMVRRLQVQMQTLPFSIIANNHKCQQDEKIPLIETICTSSNGIPDSYECPTSHIALVWSV